jgi:hypothetical protein
MIIAERMPRAISWRRSRRCGGEPRQVFARAWPSRKACNSACMRALTYVCMCLAVLQAAGQVAYISQAHQNPGACERRPAGVKKRSADMRGKGYKGHEQAYVSCDTDAG